MSFEVRPAGPESLSEVAAFVRSVYGAPENSPNLNPRLLEWKYYAPGPDWDGSRSLVIRSGEQIAAHGSVWPVPLATQKGGFKGLRVLDWGSSRPGAGAALMNSLRASADVLLGVGGSADTLRLLPALGFKARGAARLCVRVLRPWRQFRTRRFDGPRAYARLLRNIGWSRAALASSSGWSSESSDRPDVGLAEQFAARTPEYPESWHSAAFLEFMLRCPAAEVRYFQLFHEGNLQGYFVVSRVGGQARLADLRILSGQGRDWIGAYAAAVRAVSRDPRICELVTYASVPLVREAVEANGFKPRGDNVILVLDRARVLGEPAQIHLGMLDDDSAYLNDPENPYCA